MKKQFQMKTVCILNGMGQHCLDDEVKLALLLGHSFTSNKTYKKILSFPLHVYKAQSMGCANVAL